MPNLKSAKKRLRQDARRQARNRAAMSALRTALKKTNKALLAGDIAQVEPLLPHTLSMIGRSAKKGIIHPNRAARLESRLMRKVNAARSAQSQA